MTDQSQVERRGVIKRPTASFLFSLAAGIATVAYSTGLANYTQYYFITTVLVQNSFIIGLVTIFVGALTYVRPDEHSVWSLVMVSMGISELVLVTSTSLTIPFLEISPIGPAAGILALISGFLGLIFKPGIIRFATS
ncbi:hypothetical protein E6H35_06860 [Candidatus Bathyarchaeota archaeon]|nr:MAG: hypothetical protein E6H35_06860 [Candidatus Bathyarchaeota archaeon]